MNQSIRSTTVLAIVRDGMIAMASDGQVTVGEAVMKQSAQKTRKAAKHDVLIVELAKSWRTDRALRRLEALLLIGNSECVLVVSGNGDVIEPDDGIVAVGSGGNFALAAARALVDHTQLGGAEIAEAALRYAAQICIYTNDNINVVTLP